MKPYYGLNCGYRHIDCTASYGNEQEVGEALTERVGRVTTRCFITSKLWNITDVEDACKKSSSYLGLNYLELYLMHWPMAMLRRPDGTMYYEDTHYRDTWTAMEKLVDNGLVKAIGLSNFNARQIDDILSIAKHKPVVNQVVSSMSSISHCCL
ncbi:putative alcohol dehydrogenase [Triplophysa rosa]|uniref:Alcohol dehydrogenase n=1 Tax=Triplophysa rosa TaxID=992332 RepID=A0A9W8CAR1_TRIRA|nr:putative alcohol dehydrogenase [Triplophysa rosa]